MSTNDNVTPLRSRAQRQHTSRTDGTATRISSWVWVILDDEAETTLRGTLVDQEAAVDWLRLAAVTQATVMEGRPEPVWTVIDNTVIVPWARVKYLIESAPPR